MDYRTVPINTSNFKWCLHGLCNLTLDCVNTSITSWSNICSHQFHQFLPLPSFHQLINTQSQIQIISSCVSNDQFSRCSLPSRLSLWGCSSFLAPELRERIFKLLKSPRIDSKEPIPPDCVAWRAGTSTLFLLGS